MIATLLDNARARFAALRAYRRTLAELESMSRHELIDLRVYREDVRGEAWQRPRSR